MQYRVHYMNDRRRKNEKTENTLRITEEEKMR